jgi:hypothetical protein
MRSGEGMNEKFIPETLTECFRIMEEEVSDKDVEEFKNIVNANFHPLDHNMGWGLYIRNRFIPLHSPIRRKFKELGIWFEPDSISGFIRKLFWEYLNGARPNAEAVKKKIDEKFLAWPPTSKVKVDIAKVEDLLGNYEA